MDEYHSLLGLPCSKELRARLDRALCRIDRPSEERFALIKKNYTGDCILHDKDGMCALQKECGEKALSSVCRYYPRSPRVIYGYECSMSASCEGVAEMLLTREEPLTFVSRKAEFDYPLQGPDIPEHIKKLYSKIRKNIILILQRRDYTFRERLAAVGKYLSCLPIHSETELDMLKNSDDIASDYDDGIFTNDTSPDCRALEMTLSLISSVGEHHSIAEYADRAAERIRSGANALENYEKLRQNFERDYPNHEVMVEQIIVNHVFYSGFPFSQKRSTLAEYSALCALVASLRVTAIGCHDENPTLAALIDLTASAFRLYENSNFDITSSAFLSQNNYTSESALLSLINL